MSEMEDSEESGVEIKIVTNTGATKQKKFEDWEVKDWCRTLCEAEEIKADPAKMAAVKPLLDNKSKSIKSLDQLRKIASKKISRNEEMQPYGKSKEDKKYYKDGEDPDKVILA